MHHPPPTATHPPNPQGQAEAACAHYEALIAKERGKEGEAGSKVYPFLAMQYATFLKQVRGLARMRL